MIGRMYPSWIERTVNGTDGYVGATFTALLLTAGYTYDSTDIFISDLTPVTNELSGGGYVRVAPTGLVVARSSNITSVTFNPIVFSTVTATPPLAPKYMVIAKVGASDAASPLMLIQDFETAIPLASEDLTVTPSTAGFVRYTATI